MSLLTVKEKRVTFQHQMKRTALHCCVPKCSTSSRYNSQLSFHRFPANPEVTKKWLVKIKRDNFTPTESTRVCSRHFISDDFLLSEGVKRRLKKGVVPCLFEWNNFTLPAPRLNVWQRQPRPSSPDPADVEMATPPLSASLDHPYSVTMKPVNYDLLLENEALKNKVTEYERVMEEMRLQMESMQLHSRFGIQHLVGSDDDIRYYTRFASYRHFQVFWQQVERAATTKMVRITSASSSDPSQRATKLPPVDELLLFLMHLSVGLDLYDLGKRFKVHPSTASRVISTWTHFLYHLLGSIRLWIPPEIVRAHLPPEFKMFPDTQVVLDCTELFCQSPSSLLLQSEVYSTYKSHPTFKAMIGIAPHGVITFVSPLYAGSLSDKEIFKKSGIIKLLTPKMAIMVDKGFRVEDICPSKIYRPAFLLSKNIPMSKEDVQQTQQIASLRVHVERCIKRVKENSLLKGEIPLSVTGSIDQLFAVACLLSNYQNGPLVKAWAELN